jgi:hypothetical protein
VIGDANLVFESAQARYTAKYITACDSVSSRAQTPKIPYTKHELIKSYISVEQFHSLCVQRRSVRWFTDGPVPYEILNQAISTTALAPSACNGEAFNFYVASEINLATKVVTLASGKVGFAENITFTIVVIGNLNGYAQRRELNEMY